MTAQTPKHRCRIRFTPDDELTIERIAHRLRWKSRTRILRESIRLTYVWDDLRRRGFRFVLRRRPADVERQRELNVDEDLSVDAGSEPAGEGTDIWFEEDDFAKLNELVQNGIGSDHTVVVRQSLELAWQVLFQAKRGLGFVALTESGEAVRLPVPGAFVGDRPVEIRSAGENVAVARPQRADEGVSSREPPHSLEWAIERTRSKRAEEPNAELFGALDTAAKGALGAGRYWDAIAIAQLAFEHAQSGDERAIACNRETGGWDGLGRYTAALGAIRNGLRQEIRDPKTRIMLKTNLANTHCMLGNLQQAMDPANEVTRYFEKHPPTDRCGRVSEAFAYYVLGNTRRRLLENGDLEHGGLQSAWDELTKANSSYEALAEEFESSEYRGLARTCLGAIMELEVELERINPLDALQTYERGWPAFDEPDVRPSGAMLESHGWWCVFGGNVALRHLRDEPQLQEKYLSLFSRRALEVAEQMGGHWALRERAFALEYACYQRLIEVGSSVMTEWMYNEERKTLLIETMSRFEAFRGTGVCLLHRLVA